VRLVTYEHEGDRRLGALVGDVVVDLPSAVGHPAFPDTMEDLVGAGSAAMGQARRALGPEGAPERFAVEDAQLLIPLVPSSLRDFLAFEDHVKAGAARRAEPVPEAWYQIPIYYKGNHRSVIGPDEEVSWPPFTEELDFELEVAAVLGGRGRDLDAGAAAQLVLGYTLMNDWSARDIQRKEMAARLGPAKSKDFATSLGPCIVTADEFDPSSVRLAARVDGEVWAEGSLADAYWTFPQMIAHVSQGEDVWPGDVYGSGTFGGGCGLDLGRFLWPGAVVELEADGIGILRNRVGPKPNQPGREPIGSGEVGAE
jgi:2-keto-4-pentenoate hydratase/2-oxohepta-3-ene-1,7-dioic acid hydratase in catechol pathway